MHKVELYADGACSGNPGPAGIGIVLKCENRRKEFSRAIGEATNNIAEISAVTEGIKLLKAPEQTDITIYTDSQLVEGFLTRDWKPKCNLDLVQEMKALIQECNSFKVVKVRGHNGIPENEACHTLAQLAVRKEMEQGIPDAGAQTEM